MNGAQEKIRFAAISGGLALAALLAACPALAPAAELAGLWQEYDDATGKVEAFIRIEQGADGAYQGTIVRLMADVVGGESQVCGGCEGSLHNRPLLGMRILSGMRRTNELYFAGGEILDPEDGKVYRCRMKLSGDGKTLEVTGYLGISLFGQTEIWRRAE